MGGSHRAVLIVSPAGEAEHDENEDEDAEDDDVALHVGLAPEPDDFKPERTAFYCIPAPHLMILEGLRLHKGFGETATIGSA